MRHAIGTLLIAVLALGGCDDDTNVLPGSDGEQTGGEPAGDGSDALDAATQDGADGALDGGLPEDAGLDAALAADAGSDGAVTPDAGGGGCPSLAERTVVDVPFGALPDALTHWTCDHLYVLHGIVFVHSADDAQPQVLTIDPGTVVHGDTAADARGFLVVTRNGRIEASGTREAPIVFTSAKPAGMRARDDWGGLTLLGRATAGGTRRTEGFPATVGGTDINPFLAYGPLSGGMADDAHDCGTLRYVRVEFASFNAGGGQGNESNAVQVYACGHGTEVDFLQTHLSGDDGIEIFGGSVDLKHLVLTGASDDSFDWDDGWSGRAQFVVGQQHADQADLGFEAGGSSDTPLLAPNPRLFNHTLVGTDGAAVGKVGGRLRGASRGTLANFLFLGFTSGAVDIGGTAAAQNFRAGTLALTNSVFYRAQATTTFPTGADDTPDDADATDAVDSIDEAVELLAEARHNRDVDPRLPAPFDYAAPDFVPPADSPLADQALAPSEADDTRPPFFDTSAAYIGAFAPGGEDWTAGWTAYPAN